MKVDVELEPFTPLLRPTYADAHAGAISEVRMEGYEFGHTYVWQGPTAGRLEKNISYTYTHTPRDYVPASGESSAAFRTNAGRKGTKSNVSGESSKVLSAPDRRPFGKTNRLSIIDDGD